MKTSLYLVLLALFCCVLVALAQDTTPIGEENETAPQPIGEGDEPTVPIGEGEGDEPTVPTGAPEDGYPTDSDVPEKPKDSSSTENFCIAVLLECPDGTAATQNAYCEYICGAAPIGNLSYEQVYTIMQDFVSAYSGQILSTKISTIFDRDVVIQSPPESTTDYCIEVTMSHFGHVGLPDVYNGARVFYTLYDPPMCSPVVCPDGTLVSCDDVCPESDTISMFTPMTIILAVVLLSACCCCLRRRRQCRAKCQAKIPVHAPSQSQAQSQAQAQYIINTTAEDSYPAEQYHLLQQEQEQVPATEIPMHPYMGQPFYPPMPVIPPQMMMMPNGTYPIMMQAPNGMWYPVAPHPEDA